MVKRASSSQEKGPAKRPRIRKGTAGAEVDDRNKQLKFKSPAEFFAENKNIAGFDNPGKSLYTTIRELVENGLDAAEAVPVLPEILVTVQQIGSEDYREMLGMEKASERIDEKLYKDVENAAERKKRLAKEKREAAKLKKLKEKAEENGTQGSEKGETSKKARGADSTIFKVTVRDNGTGMAHDDVPQMMGRVLAGTKYRVQQSRGKFGLGSKMALIWSKMSTGLPVTIKTAKKNSAVTICVLDIDISKNEPNILRHEKVKNIGGQWVGTEVSVTIGGSWSKYRPKIVSYMRQMAVITPYAHFLFKYIPEPGREDRGLEIDFTRRSEKMPPAPSEVKHHPSSVNQLLIKQLIGDALPKMTLSTFLSTEFNCVTSALASRLVAELGDDFSPSMPVSSLTLHHIRRIDALLHAARFDKPSGKCLSPAGEYNLRLGIMKEFKPTMVATYAEPADVFEGHPFIVEAGVALGGTVMKPGINVFRFANRIPLLFESGNDVVTQTANKRIRWGSYKISTTTDRIGVTCSIVSTRIPFKGTGKEYIADDAESIQNAVKRAITQCCSQLRSKLARKAAMREAADRKKNIVKYVPDVANAIVKLFESVDEAQPGTRDVFDEITSGGISRETLKNKLLDHVDATDKAEALDLVTSSGRDTQTVETVFLAPLSKASDHVAIHERGTHTVLRLLRSLQKR
eukprot:Plantae.Rhodophyta-Hildenbrandia_rubra.ctg4724.p2 GENE.Plantae.Rhodophyta-Hildenbrandia_rubra.ctg4724~~Plantae.Rhodophyta-Hildenbrandia_rubra.ctg4724.p2  ORF type:complete len:687 (+),score=144.55 Plantae.Rhodophyta-Hildenbrandia_rubra.ctg4724:4625-6685(+)